MFHINVPITATTKSAVSMPASFCAVTVYFPALAASQFFAVNLELSDVFSMETFLNESTGLPLIIQVAFGLGEPEMLTWSRSREPVFTVWVDSSFLS